MSYTWEIGTDRADGGITANGELSDNTPELTRGEDVTLEFAFWHDDGIDATATGHRDRYKALRAYSEFAGSCSVNRSLNGTPRYTEHVPADAPTDTLLLDFRPGASIEDLPGLWGLVQAVEDSTRFTDVALLSVTFTLLGDTDDYATAADVEAALLEAVV